MLQESVITTAEAGAAGAAPPRRVAYLLDNADPRAGRRFDALERLFDARATALLDALGVSPGWSCWEIGAGGGSIAVWLAERVGPFGSVRATDIDLRWFTTSRPPALTAEIHDVVRDPIPRDAYDLIHARLVLVHLPERERVLEALVGALRPGGLIMIEDFDHVFLDGTAPTTGDERTVRRVAIAFKELLARSGGDTAYARRLPDLLRALGLDDVAGEGRLLFGDGGSPPAHLLAANLSQVANELIEAGLCSGEELEAASRLLDQPRVGVFTPTLISAWGRRPR